ncbi:DUF3472 domain-containing protein [Aquimarina sp. TRL1]|uniref:DUF3472 domain-containing protein n=1 Tax=Aquimarina sp. (strain TRL1) TaxID=2736252 RepID=UPI00158CA328|nr:RICIN domain-containing protein [Aquimarina sp. TRL1]QKX06829.1 DUF3472 domain-containing protein [Aquimarina sp. TRL1]
MKNTILNLVIITLCNITFAQNSAPSSHLTAKDKVAGDILMKTVRSTITTDATYYCTMQWNGGAEGGAYCGFQDSPDKGHTFIYSIWDPSNGKTITADFVGEGTKVENFGGEGTGLKSMNNTIGWSLNEWNTVVTRRWDVGTHSYFGFWVRRDSQNKWYHMVTMNYPVANVTFNSDTNAFLEDWLSTGSKKRRFEMKDGFKRKLDGNWVSMNEAVYKRNDEPRSENYTNAVDAGVSNGVYFMQSGGNSTPSFPGTPPITLRTNTNAQPSNPAISFSISTLSSSKITWEVPTSATPQFKYTIKINNNTVQSKIAPETRTAAISATPGSIVELTLEDILGRTTTQTKTITTNSVLPNGVYKVTFENSQKSLDTFGMNNGSNIGLYESHGGPNQQWEVINLGNNIYKITNIKNGKSIDAFGQNNGDNIGSYEYHGGPNQKWEINIVSNGVYQVTDYRSKKCIDAFGTSNGSNIGLYECHGGSNQNIRFTLVSTRKNSKEITSDLSSYIYQNAGVLYININDATRKKAKVSVFSIQGSEVIKKEIYTGKPQQINLINLAKGLYILKTDGNLVKKITVQ